jgi:hypothetical protein
MLSKDHRIESSAHKEGWLQKMWTLVMGEDIFLEAAPGSSGRALHATTHKLVQVQRQVDRLQSQHNMEMARLAQAYHELSQGDRRTLPQKLQQQLNRIESEYF